MKIGDVFRIKKDLDHIVWNLNWLPIKGSCYVILTKDQVDRFGYFRFETLPFDGKKDRLGALPRWIEKDLVPVCGNGACFKENCIAMED